MKRLSRRLVKGAGHLLLGGSIALALFAVALFGVGLYLASVPYARISRRHAQMLAFVQLAQAAAALLAAMRQPDESELGGEPSAADPAAT